MGGCIGGVKGLAKAKRGNKWGNKLQNENEKRSIHAGFKASFSRRQLKNQPFPVGFFSPFPSSVGPGLRAIGLLLRSLQRARPRQRKGTRNRLAAACRCSTDALEHGGWCAPGASLSGAVFAGEVRRPTHQHRLHPPHNAPMIPKPVQFLLLAPLVFGPVAPRFFGGLFLLGLVGLALWWLRTLLALLFGD